MPGSVPVNFGTLIAVLAASKLRKPQANAAPSTQSVCLLVAFVAPFQEMELEEEVLHKAAVMPGSVPVTGTYSKTEREYQAAMGNIGGARATEVGVHLEHMTNSGGMCMRACMWHAWAAVRIPHVSVQRYVLQCASVAHGEVVCTC